MKGLSVAFVMLIFAGILSGQDFKAADSKKFDRTTTEWMSLYGGGGNYGPGGSLSFFTVRTKHFFWEIARFQITIIDKKEDASYLFKTVYGASIYLDSRSRHEIRIGTGFSGGFTHKKIFENDYDSRAFHSIINIPIDIYYVVHIKRYFAFQTGISLDMPLNFDVDDYRPVVFAFAGFRI